jgi:hypothetical protein
MNRMKERAMRWVSAILLILLLISGMASPALAADYDLPILRGSSQPPAPVVTVGPATFTRWSGFYFGGDVSLGSATSDFSTTTRPLVQFSLQHTTVETNDRPSDFQILSRGSAVAAGGGAFLGYNTQWQDGWRRSFGIAFVSEFPPDCRGCVRALCTPTCAQKG